jgi:hypothetical protein
VGSDEPLRELENAPRSVAFAPARVQRVSRRRGQLFAGLFAATLVGVVAIGVAGPGRSVESGADGTGSNSGEAIGAGAPASPPSGAQAGARRPPDPGSIALQVLPDGASLSILGDVAARAARSVIVTVYDSTGTVTDWRSLSLTPVDGGLRPDHWPTFAVTVKSAGPDTLQAIEAVAYDARGGRLASTHRFIGPMPALVSIPRAMVAKD